MTAVSSPQQPPSIIVEAGRPSSAGLIPSPLGFLLERLTVQAESAAPSTSAAAAAAPQEPPLERAPSPLAFLLNRFVLPQLNPPLEQKTNTAAARTLSAKESPT